MNISLKTPQEIKIMERGGKKLALILTELLAMAQPGVNLLDIEKRAGRLIKRAGGTAAFSRVPQYRWATCLNVNDEIVHTIPKNYNLKKGDLLNIDIGLFYQGFNTDMSSTVQIQAPNLPSSPWLRRAGKRLIPNVKEVKRFLETGRKALEEAKKQAKVGHRIGHISQAIQKVVEGSGFSVARNLSGHGIGRDLHEPPSIPGFLAKPIRKTMLIKPGMTLALEVIYCFGKPDLILDKKNNWTMRTKDGKISAVFEETIAVLADGLLVLTKIPWEKFK